MSTGRDFSLNSDIPKELLTEILARLPVKTLLKFRIVCKSWCTLIGSSDLVFQHLKLYAPNSGNSRLLLGQERINDYTFTICHSDTLRKIDDEIAKFPLPFTVFQSLNGLLLILQTYNEKPILKLWNPSIRKCLIIPKCPLKCENHPGFFKLGFADTTKDYKLVVIGDRRIAVYSVNDHRWRVKDTTNSVNDDVKSWLHGFRSPVYSEGVLYWQSYTAARFIYSFNFENEELRFLQVPDAVNSDLVSFIFRLGESLAIFSMGFDSTAIWVLEINGNGRDYDWRGSYHDIGQPNSNGLDLFLTSSPILYIQGSNTFLMVQKVGVVTDRVMSYNYITHEIQHLGKALNGKMSFDAYIETLALQKGVKGQTLLSFP